MEGLTFDVIRVIEKLSSSSIITSANLRLELFNMMATKLESIVSKNPLIN